MEGEIEVEGAKNATLPILASCLLAPDESVIHGVPRLRDIEVMLDILVSLGARVKWEGSTVAVNCRQLSGVKVPDSLMRKMRASNLVMGALLGRCRKFEVSYPGGCSIGSRPMDLHLKGFLSMGAEISEESGCIQGETRKLQGTCIYLDFPSVGATENLMMAAVLAEGATIIRNAAREPEIVDLQNFLCGMGAQVRGAGTDKITIEGVKSLGAGEHRVIPDRIEAGTHLIAAAITGGDVLVTQCRCDHVEALLSKLGEMGCHLNCDARGIRIKGCREWRAVDIKTHPYPGFPTDLQPQIMSLLSLSKGTSVVKETIFESRFKHADELRRMGARIKVEGRIAVIQGVKRLTGATVEASDLRAAAALVIGGLAAEGETIIEKVCHLDRGYHLLEEKYARLGAEIARLPD
ncbi:MAG: UDP-N-acetylglucosamine 1-carboxyvinyltransferase [Syntrophomonadaceae bacterium]|nr:UDP-N-acetylglucosamine 1-carboxyvinyltransferase [Syntrophomonadaceae bacterium]